MYKIENLFPEYLSKAQRWALLAAITFSTISAFFLTQYRITDEAHHLVKLAVLTKQNKIVTRKISDSLSYSDVTTGDNIFNGDQVFTGENSEATVVFLESKNVIQIPSKSLVRIEKDQNGENVEIKNGLAEFIIQKNQVINIIKGDDIFSLSSAPGTVGVVKAYTQGNKLMLKVNRGNIILDNKKSGKIEKISLSESVSLDKGILKKTTGFEVLSPSSGEKIDIWSGIKIELSKSEPVSIFLSNNENFKVISAQTQTKILPFRWNPKVGIGEYFLKLVSRNGFETIVPISFYSSLELTQFKPTAREVVQIKKGEPLILRWRGVKTQKYKVVVHDYQKNVFEYITPDSELSLKSIKGSFLSWTVAPMAKDGNFLDQSKPNEVLINYIGENKLLSPANETQFNLGESPIHFSWDGLPNETFKIIIRNNQNASNILERVLNANSFDFLPNGIGSLTFMLASVDYPNLPRLEFSFDVKTIVGTWNIKDINEYSDVDEEKKIVFGFESKVKDIKTLELKISTSKNFDQTVQGYKIISKKIKYTMKKFGDYCFKINSIKPDPFLQDSELKCVTFKQIPAFSSIVAPKNVVMSTKKINGIEGYTVEVPTVERAVIFEIQVFKDIQGNELVYTTRSKSNIMTWISSKSGIYYYRYRAIDSKNRKSIYSSLGKLIFPISPLSDWQK